MHLIDAMTMRDGGTTSITVTQGVFTQVSYTIDYSLPWDGRKRYIFKGQPFEKEESKRLEVGGEEEVRLYQSLMGILNRRFGDTVVTAFLSDQIENPGKGKWFYVLNFAKVMTKERSGYIAGINRT